MLNNESIANARYRIPSINESCSFSRTTCYALLAVCIVFLLSMVGCANPSNASSAAERSHASRQIKGHEGISLEYVLRQEGEKPQDWNWTPGQFLYHSGECYPIDGYAFSPSASQLIMSSDEYASNELIFKGGRFLRDEPKDLLVDSYPVSVSAGDQIITTVDTQFHLVPVGDVYYTSAGNDGAFIVSGQLNGLFSALGGGAYGFDEIEGRNLEGLEPDEKTAVVEDTLRGLGLAPFDDGFNSYWISKQPVDVETARYEGTEWMVETHHFDSPVLLKPAGAEAIGLQTVKTHDGYFYVDLNGVPTGNYLFAANKSDKYYYIRIE